MSIFAVASLMAAAVCLSAQAPSAGVRSQVAARLTEPVKESSLLTLRGNTHPLAQPRYDQGLAPQSMPANRMLLVLNRSAQQEADLKSYLAGVQTPGSASYHKFLTPEQFGALYGPADADLETVSKWLQGHGLTVNKVNKARTIVEFSGSIAQIQETFHTQIHSYLVKGVQHYANVSDPQIPAALAPVVAGVAQMHNFMPRRYAVPGPRGEFDPATRTFKPLLTGTGKSGSFLYLGPSDAATIYNSPITGLNKNFKGTTTYDGTGVTIGIAGDANIDLAGVANYRSFFGLAPKAPNVIVDGDDPGVGDINTTDTGEALLDVEVASGMAPGATINLYTAANTTLQSGLFLAIYRALDDNAVSILNVSFGGCEGAQGTTNNASIYSAWEEAAAQGISVTVATGDSGAAGCDSSSATVAVNGLAVSGLASTPYNIAVGGTDFDVLANSFSTYVGSSNVSPYLGTALKYIPETPWNNSTDTNTTIGANTAFLDTSGNTDIVAAGGGASSCVALDTSNTICQGGWPKPSWQKNLDNGNLVRDLPDVSMFASQGFYHAGWAICATGTKSGTAVNDCQTDSTGQISSVTIFGGTSTSSPAFAGVLAIVTQSEAARLGQSNVRLGQANQVLYPLAKQFPAAFHDVTAGNISVPCTGGAAANCGTNGFLTGYEAKAGYDLATGLGSVDVGELAADWGKLTFAKTTTALTLNGGAGAFTIVHGAPVTVAVKVTGSGTPTGDVAIVDDLNASTNPNNSGAITQGAPLTLTAGAASATLNSPASNGALSGSLPGGSYNVIAHYAGDGVNAASDSNPVLVNVNQENSKITISPAVYDPGARVFLTVDPKALQVPYGYITVVDATPIGTTYYPNSDGTATGTVTYTGAGLTAYAPSLNSQGFAELRTASIAPGAQTINVAYAGDKSFNPSSGSLSLTIVKGATATTETASAITSSKVAAGLNSPFNPSSGNPSPGNPSPVQRFSWYGAGGAALACVALFGIPARRRGWRAMLALMLFATFVSLAGGCGGGGGQSTPVPVPVTSKFTMSVAVATDSLGTPPTGTVTFNLGATSLGTASVTGAVDPTSGLDTASASAVIATSLLKSGANGITATYGGDANYASSVSPAVTVTVP